MIETRETSARGRCIRLAGATSAFLLATMAGAMAQPGEPPCGPLPAGTAAGCVASFPIAGIDVWPSTSIALSAQAGALLAAGPVRGDDSKQALVAYGIADGRELWRLPVEGAKRSVAVSAAGDRAALWNPGGPAIRVLAIPDGRPVAEVPGTWLGEDVSFAADGAAIVLGDRNARRIHRLADGATTPVPGFGNAECSGPVGQSNLDRVTSRDNGVTVQVNTGSDSLSFRAGRIESAPRLARSILCDTPGFAILPPPADRPDAYASYLSFSPGNDRLAVVYDVSTRDGGASSTVIEIRDMSARPGADEAPQPAAVLASFAIDGMVYQRLGWSADGHRLAVLHDPAPGADRPDQPELRARIYAVP
jgi:hypothetical protein